MLNEITTEKPSASARAVSAPRCELLAPAGDWDCARAAVENGADAIYFGLERFNARMRAHNFTEADLPRLMEFLHARGVKGYVTFNTLVFAGELAEAARYIKSIVAAGVDAAIVQDVGVCRLIRRVSPDFPIHASTQMTISSAAGIAFAKELGCGLVVLARECSVKEIEAMQGQGSASAAFSLPLEVFVHGALCVAYSGQCLTSESLGGRSANRGECAQACRMPYDLVADGQTVPLGDKRYLLSPQDLSGLEVLPDLLKSGVSSLKIEGRLKSPEYVANITRVYRMALDKILGPGAGGFSSGGETALAPDEARYNLEMGFSRGLYTGWFRGVNNRELAHARFGKKRGVRLGKVVEIQRGRVAVDGSAPVKPGDGIVFDAGNPDKPEEGGRIYGVQVKPGRTWLEFGREDVDFGKVAIGNIVWKTSDPELDRRLRQSFAGEDPKYQRPLDLEVHGAVGGPLTVIARDDSGHVAKSESAVPLARAERQPLTDERLRAQLGRLGGTPFLLRGLDSRLDGDAMLFMSELNRLRRELVAELQRQRAQPRRWAINDTSADSLPSPPKVGAPVSTELVVLVRSLDQLDAAVSCGVRTVYCEFEDPKKHREAVQRFHSACSCEPGPARTIWVAPPRIFKTGEEWILKIVRSSNADGYLVRNYDHLSWFGDCRRIGDFSLNVANPLSAEYFTSKYGLERVTASYDLNVDQLDGLVRGFNPALLEVTVHQHMPMFHMEHCVFCAFLSSGKDYRDCGRPCDTHEVKLRDRMGAEHPLKADAGCRNTVYNSRAQTGAEYVANLVKSGVGALRLEFLNESAAETARTIAQYRKLLRGETTGAELWRELKLVNQLGVTRGQMENRSVGQVGPKPGQKPS